MGHNLLIRFRPQQTDLNEKLLSSFLLYGFPAVKVMIFLKPGQDTTWTSSVDIYPPSYHLFRTAVTQTS